MKAYLMIELPEARFQEFLKWERAQQDPAPAEPPAEPEPPAPPKEELEYVGGHWREVETRVWGLNLPGYGDGRANGFAFVESLYSGQAEARLYLSGPRFGTTMGLNESLRLSTTEEAKAWAERRVREAAEVALAKGDERVRRYLFRPKAQPPAPPGPSEVASDQFGTVLGSVEGGGQPTPTEPQLEYVGGEWREDGVTEDLYLPGYERATGDYVVTVVPHRSDLYYVYVHLLPGRFDVSDYLQRWKVVEGKGQAKAWAETEVEKAAWEALRRGDARVRENLFRPKKPSRWRYRGGEWVGADGLTYWAIQEQGPYLGLQGPQLARIGRRDGLWWGELLVEERDGKFIHGPGVRTSVWGGSLSQVRSQLEGLVRAEAEKARLSGDSEVLRVLYEEVAE